MPDILDTAVLDYLTGNGDRHMFEIDANAAYKFGRILHIDNGKT